MPGKELFHYNHVGYPQTRYNVDTVCVSEGELPKCEFVPSAAFLPRINDLPIGSIVNIAIGNLIVLRECQVIEVLIADIPEELFTDFRRFKYVYRAFLYKGKKLWVRDTHVCLFEEIESLKYNL